MSLVGRIRAVRLSSLVKSYATRYLTTDTAQISAVQLDLLNASWEVSCSQSPWARALCGHFGLPSRFSSWEEFDAVVPVVGKADLRPILEAGTREPSRKKDHSWRATGGSTAEPFRFPVWREEEATAALDIWLGRQRLGIRPDDRLFLLWGHAHLFGSGVQGSIARAKRQLSDRLLGYTRFSAYDLSTDALRTACDLLLRVEPRYLVGYSCALDRFARANAARENELAALALKAVIATAEGFPRPDSRDRIAKCFGAPVVMEYGTVETGPIAYERLTKGYDVFWLHHRLQRRGGVGPAADELLVTSLYPRALPLMRYEVGDLIQTENGAAMTAPVTGFQRVVGRSNDAVMLPGGAIVHSEALTHCLRDVPGMLAFQVVVPPGAWPILRYEAAAPVSEDALTEIRRRLTLIDPGLAQTPIERAHRLKRSIAGKHRMVVES